MDSMSREFKLDSETRLQFLIRDGKWSARVRESVGIFSRDAILPVVCPIKDELTDTLEALFKQSHNHVTKRVHILSTSFHSLHKRVVFIGQLGLRGGSSSDDDSSSSSSSSSHSVINLPELLTKGKIKKTKALVKAFNECSRSNRSALNEWGSEYINWLNEIPVASLEAKSEKPLIEYRLLSHLLPDKSIHKVFLKTHFETLVQKVLEDKLGKVFLMESLEYCLQSLDKCVFSNDPSTIQILATALLEKLDPVKNVMEKTTFSLQRSTLYACYHTLRLLKVLLEPAPMVLDNEGSLYSQFLARLDAISKSAEYYPYNFHTHLLSRMIYDLGSEKEVGISNWSNKDATGVKKQAAGVFAIMNFGGHKNGMSKLVTVEDLTHGGQFRYHTIYSTLAEFDADTQDWYCFYTAMEELALLSLQSEAIHGEFYQLLEITQEQVAKGHFKVAEDLKALSYGIISQLGRLALEASSENVQKSALESLINLSDSKKRTEGLDCFTEYDLCEEYLESLAKVTVYGVNDAIKFSAYEAIRDLYDKEKGTSGTFRFFTSVFKKNKKSQEQSNVTKWFDDKNFEEKIGSVPPPRKHHKLGKLFKIILQRLTTKHGVEIHAHHKSTKENKSSDNTSDESEVSSKESDDDDDDHRDIHDYGGGEFVFRVVEEMNAHLYMEGDGGNEVSYAVNQEQQNSLYIEAENLGDEYDYVNDENAVDREGDYGNDVFLEGGENEENIVDTGVYDSNDVLVEVEEEGNLENVEIEEEVEEEVEEEEEE